MKKHFLFSETDALDSWNVYDSQASLTNWQDCKVLTIGGGTPVIWADEVMKPPFRMECTVAIERREGYVGCVFGATSKDDYEVIYIYPDLKGDLGWIQYDPSMNGSMTWQIYHGPRYQASKVSLESQQWIKLRVDVQPNHILVTVGENNRPQLIIHQLMQGTEGRIGLWGFLPVYIKELSITSIEERAVAISPEPIHLPVGLITKWEVALAKDLDLSQLNTSKYDWKEVSVEENGTLNINRLYRIEDKNVLVRSRILCEAAGEYEFSFGFSDEIMLWVNERQVFEGKCVWNPPVEEGRISIGYKK